MRRSSPGFGARLLAGVSTFVLASLLVGALQVTVSAAAAPPGSTPTSASPPPNPGSTQSTSGNPFGGVLRYLDTRQGVVQVAVFNADTGQTYQLSNGTAPQATASIVKVDILAEWLHNYEAKGVSIPTGIPFSIQYLMQQMIESSDNAAATALFYFGGGCKALTAFNKLIPTKSTTVGCQTPIYYGWGNTTTSAEDQVAVVKAFAYPNSTLGTDARAYGLGLMQKIQAGQGWGVSCGPWGPLCYAPNYAQPVAGVTVALKNGWKYVPSCLAQDQTCPWQINSIGWVKGDGRDYAIAVLSTNNPAGPGLDGYNYGIDTVQNVSQLVWKNLAPSHGSG